MTLIGLAARDGAPEQADRSLSREDVPGFVSGMWDRHEALEDATAGESRPSGFDRLPLAEAGTLSGRIVYLTREGCRLRQYDLGSGRDESLSEAPLCPDVSYPVLSPDGSYVAERAEDGRIRLASAGGEIRFLGPRLPPGRAPGGFRFPPLFSPDGRQIAYCVASGRRSLATVVAHVPSGRVRERIRRSCRIAFTRRGPVVARASALELRGRVIYRPRQNVLASGIGSPVAANAAGTLLVVATRPRKRSAALDLRVLDLTGRERSRFRLSTPVPSSVVELAPRATSAVLWWGCILQLAAFDGRGRASRHFGEGGEIVSPPGYSPDGRYAAMGRFEPRLGREPPAPPKDTVVLDARTFDGLYRLPFDAARLVWLP